MATGSEDDEMSEMYLCVSAEGGAEACENLDWLQPPYVSEQERKLLDLFVDSGKAGDCVIVQLHGHATTFVKLGTRWVL